MKTKLQIFIVLVFVFFNSNIFATHIVGGSLTYVYNGGSSYTVTLKLYKDCGPGTAGFPNNILVSVRGLNGATFNPSKDILLNTISTTNILSTLDPCAIPPNPTPCVQERIYTATVNNLPPNSSGYHLYFQIVARNGSLVNVVTPLNTGESFYAFIPGGTSIWNENFTLPNGTTSDIGATAWSITNGIPSPLSAQVQGNQFQIQGANNAEVTWTSQVVNISTIPTGVTLSAELNELGDLEAQDSVFVYYRLNGGPLTLFATNGFIINDFNNATASQTNVIGTTVQIIIRVHYSNVSPANEIYNVDNVTISGGFIPNSNATFDLFPPLFLCVNEPFSFDHSATDLDGDSLAYCLYNPYNGDNGAGALDPTFAGNIASFTPINWIGGFSTNNPLGGTPINLDPTTGLLTGTPTLIGQFVVGVKVKEYRNGVQISETLRDFQFNILNCPQPNPPIAGNDITINQGCSSDINASGFISNTVNWTSIFPGLQGTYDGFLSCTSGCLNTTVTPNGTPPAFIDFQICGTAASCNAINICDTVRVFLNPSLSVSISPINPIICFGQTSTTLTANGSGGTPPYSYLWNNVNPSQTNIVGAGTFTVMISDTSGCPPAFATITVTQFTNPITANAGPDLTICNQTPTATINANVSGATGGVWSGGNGLFSPNNTTLNGVTYTPTPTELANGFVDLFLTSTGNSTCPLDIDTVRINYVGFTGVVNLTTTSISCYGANDGTSNIAVTGGFPSHTFSWNSIPLQTAATATGLSPGNYIVTIQDSIGCSTLDSVIILEPLPLILGNSITNVSCFGGNNGAATINVNGGTAPYTYSWNIGGFTSPTITSQLAGNYTTTVSDANGCSDSILTSITQPQQLAISFSSTNVSCFGGNDGSALASVIGGVAPYSYFWTPNGGTASNATGLTSGSYTLSVTDANGCVAIDSVSISEPLLISSTITTNNVSCNGLSNGSISISAAGGTFPYLYQWSPNVSSSANATNLAAGTYSITITDALGCQLTQFATITAPQPLTLSTNQINVNCFGGNNGSGSVLTTGGTAPYSYLWSPGLFSTSTVNNLTANTYSITVIDANGCQALINIPITQPSILSATSVSTPTSCFSGNDGTLSVTPIGGIAPYTYFWLPNGQTTSSITGLNAGNYSVTVTDANGCTNTINDVVSEPTPLVISSSSTNVSCFSGSNGSISTSVTGGTAPYTYSWLPSGGTNALATGLSIGNYTVTVIDGNGCVSTNSTTITQPTPLVGSATSTNETCTNSNNGTATILASGGTAPYSYAWSPTGGVNASATGLTAGNYVGTITDNLGCQTNVSVLITEPPLLTLTTSQSNVSCFGSSNGTATVIPSGGTPNYSFLWSPSGSTSTIATNLLPGSHSVTATDNNGCQSLISVIITQPALLTAALTTVPTSCFGGNDGSATATVSGGTSPFTYLWMPGNITNQTATNLSAGTYTFTVTDINGCVFTNTVNVNEPPQLVLNSGAIGSTCGFSNGIAFVNVTSGGVAPFNYLWSPSGGTADTAFNLNSGTYTVVVTDANGCSNSATSNVNGSTSPLIIFASSTNVSCNAGNDGATTISVSGGVGPFTYFWAPSGNTTPSVTNLSAGVHTVTVTGANGCASSATTTITEPSSISANVVTSPVSCFGGNNGTAFINTFGGIPGYTINWLATGTNGSNVTNLSAGLDSVMVIDANGCQLIVNYTVAQPLAPISAVLSSTPVSCFGASTGSVSALAIGGTAPYTYSWMPGNINGATLSNLNAGNYIVTITDANGCTFFDSITVTEPPIINLTTTTIDAHCGQADGQATVVANGGVGGYSYLWIPSGITSATATNLFAGNYTVTVTDGNACLMQSTVTINDLPAPTALITGTTNVNCFGGNDGSATVLAAGGTAPYTYLWTPIGGINATATTLTTGVFSVVVTDANGCQSTPAITPQITQPNKLVATFNITNVSCFNGLDGVATVNPIGGVAPYTYFWFSSGATTQTNSSLSAGLDSVRITDNNGCFSIFTYTISQPPLLSSAITNSSNVSCFGGANGGASVSVNGGSPLYSYQWLPFGGNANIATGLTTGNYTVTITDSKGCITSSNVTISQPTQQLTTTIFSTPNSCFGGSNGIATANPVGGTPGYTYQWLPSGGSSQSTVGLPIGNYTVTVTDTNGCTANSSINVTQPPALAGNLEVINPSCGLQNGIITSQITGGSTNYSYFWTPGNQTTPVINSLSSGNYSLQVTDANGCLLTISTILNNIPTPTIAVINSTNVSCFNGINGSATALANSGVPPYSYSWSPFGGLSSNTTSLSAGNYTITVTDSLGCTASDSVLITQPNPLTLFTTSINPVSCNGGNNGQITVSANGGTPTYSYSWSPVTASQPTISNLVVGNYVATVTDQNNCASSISITITEPAQLLSSIATSSDPLCFNSSDGTATVAATGGTLPYTYLWSNGQTGLTAFNLVAGGYNVSVTDANGCTSTSNTILNQPTPVVTIAGLNDTICLGQQGVLSATAIGGAGAYNFGWQPVGVTNNGILNVSPTTNTSYTVVAFDQNGCPGNIDTVLAFVYELMPTDIIASSSVSLFCLGQGIDISAQSIATNSGPLTYTWNNGFVGSGPFQVFPTQPTTYIVTATNNCGSQAVDSVRVEFSPPPTIIFDADNDTACFPASIQFTDNSLTGNFDDQIHTWNWNFGDGTTSITKNPLHTYTSPGTYNVTLTVTTGNGCSTSSTVPLTIFIFPRPTAAFTVNSSIFYLPTEQLVTTNLSTGASIYNWSFGDGGTSTAVNPVYLYNLIGTFVISLTATNEFGCSDVATIDITTDADVVFPNAFTPNTSGPSGGFYDVTDLSNDIFFPYTSGVIDYQFEIFNRWGELIFATNEIKQGWDGYYKGEIVQQGVYIWKAYLKLNNGKEINKSGDVTLLR